MLVLERGLKENLFIILEDGREIRLQVIDMPTKQCNSVRIGIEAPKTIRVVRQEAKEKFKKLDMAPMNAVS